LNERDIRRDEKESRGEIIWGEGGEIGLNF
jgi:hypothetical protein